jgi:hypothetical protein
MKGLFRINKITVTVDVSDKQYGAGDARSVHLSAESPIGEGLEWEKMDQATGYLMDMFLEAFRGVQSARYVSGEISASELNELVQKAEMRANRVKSALEGS